jgi:outer membrane protein OmpA-like peptidoglycan-associated protein
MNHFLFSISVFLFLTIGTIQAQETEIIYLQNPSFEDQPRPGNTPESWADCGQMQESPPDVQPYGGFNVTRPAKDGKTYIGFVTRDNKTWEGVSQRLSSPLQQGKCYRFSLAACKSPTYISPTKKNQTVPVNFGKGIILRIWGGNSHCDRAELLDKIDAPVEHFDWREYKFEFNPEKSNYSYILIESYYKTPTLNWYNGNILVDNASEIFSCDIPDENPVIAQVDNPEKKPKKINTKPIKKTEPKVDPLNPKKTKPNTSTTALDLVDKGNFNPEEIDVKNLKVGHLFRLEKLYFPADSSRITRNSEKVLYNLYRFLRDNEGLSVEIGGHTNGLPAHDYCDRLSKARAKNVASYLTKQGIDKDRISFKGYGKRKPISDNETVLGRSKNQRVELIVTDIRKRE